MTKKISCIQTNPFHFVTHKKNSNSKKSTKKKKTTSNKKKFTNFHEK